MSPTVPEFFLSTLLQEAVLCSPIAAVTAFLSLTRTDPIAHKFKTARTACMLAMGILLFFCFTGDAFFKIFDVQKEAFQIAGGLLLFYIGFDMLIASDGFEADEATEKDSKAAKGGHRKLSDVAITPVAIPLLSGPGAISGTVLLTTAAPSLMHRMAIYCAIPVACVLIYGLFSLSIRGSALISPFLMKVAHRLSGLILAAMAVQFVLRGLHSLGIISI